MRFNLRTIGWSITVLALVMGLVVQQVLHKRELDAYKTTAEWQATVIYVEQGRGDFWRDAMRSATENSALHRHWEAALDNEAHMPKLKAPPNVLKVSPM